MPNFSRMKFAWVPLPAPGGPEDQTHDGGLMPAFYGPASRSCGVSTPGGISVSLTATAMRWPCHRARSCSSASAFSSGAGASAAIAAQETDAVGVDAGVPVAARRATSASGYGNSSSAEKYSA